MVVLNRRSWLLAALGVFWWSPFLARAQTRPTLVLTFESDEQLTRVVDAMCARHGYSATLGDGTPNPQTRREFVRQRIAQWVRGEVREHELNTARSLVTVAPLTVE